ncbi:GNAT family N-acetyltransferase [Marivita hallyeonensis]|uniref:Acetyltransferase (GNAT) family protein n=1 Tax=Marivita hallyeonensis TaxID=996342 RepID=A0A1M5NJJ5_9RHOB|nr:GNAT family N-acetyltransferase [Marivita hallyeonensis]SHG89764.1 Acetyltransferase (GNAT) family protein [Marivita hallyeonensis]
MPIDLSLTFADTKPDVDELSELLTEYYAQIQERLMNVGGPRLSIDKEVKTSIAALDQFMPPNGAILLARDSSGFLLGCGFMRMLDANRAELKRLYVRDLARGFGLGRKLIEMRIEKAREMGATTIYADTVRGNSSMLALYDRLGFGETPRYNGNGNPPELDKYLVYRKLDLEAA